MGRNHGHSRTPSSTRPQCCRAAKGAACQLGIGGSTLVRSGFCVGMRGRLKRAAVQACNSTAARLLCDARKQKWEWLRITRLLTFCRKKALILESTGTKKTPQSSSSTEPSSWCRLPGAPLSPCALLRQSRLANSRRVLLLIMQVGELIGELNELMAGAGGGDAPPADAVAVAQRLSPQSRAVRLASARLLLYKAISDLLVGARHIFPFNSRG